jgi:outer membrane receptor protein involved in Fe transport
VCAPAGAQTAAVLQGRVFDASGAVLHGATITVRNRSTGFVTVATTDAGGRYHVPAIPVGVYDVTVAATGFQSETLEKVSFEVGRTLVRDFQLAIGGRTESLVVTAGVPVIDRATSTVGHVVSSPLVQEIPLNGRHYIDLGLLVPGSVAPSQTGFSSTPIRGVGALAFNTAGNREEAVGYVVNGVTTNNLTFGSLGFSPPIASIHEFKVDNSTFSAEYGHVSGAIVNLVTRSGTNEIHGEAYEFFRNDALDASNYFEDASEEPGLFERNQFGGGVGGPIVRDRSFWFATYEGLRQRQGLDVNSLVLSDAQRAQAADPVVRGLLDLIPVANAFDADGTPRFVGSAFARVDDNIWTVDTRYNAGTRDRVQVFLGRDDVRAIEPISQGTSIPGFGIARRNVKSLMTVTGTHVFRANLLNEARFGRTAQDGATYPANSSNPASFGIGNGVARPIGLPQMLVAGGLNFGGPAIYPQGRDDRLYVFNDTLTYVSGRHSVRAGGEYRRFRNDNFAEGTGQFNFPSVAAFMSGTANAFSITLGERRSRITQDALAFFVQDQIALRGNLTLDLGLRYEWHVTPTERDDQFVVFDASSASLLRVGVHVDKIYRENNRNFEPRVGVVWAPSGDRTVVRAAYGWAVDQPGTTAVRDTAANPPFATPVAASGSIHVSSAVSATQPIDLAPVTIDPRFRNATLQSWNVNVQRQFAPGLAATIGYFGSRGRHLRISRNLNQPVDGVRPFPLVSMASPISPGAPLGVITQVESTGFSRYHGLWISTTRRLSSGLMFDASYTWSKSMDTNSLNSSGFAVQNGYDVPGQYGLSDFDARHRVVLSAVYQLPFSGHALIRGWQFAAIVQAQSGNPVNIVTSNSSLNGVPNTVRPDVTGPIRIIGSVDQWFDPSVFVAVDRFGNLGRNAVIGPAFHTTDVSILKTMTIARRYRLQFRADAFDVFNVANFGPPGNVVGSPTFAKISRTRLPTGEAGSSRQIQIVVKLLF